MIIFIIIATYTPFWKLNMIVSDVNNDNIPEIITWGRMTHESYIYFYQCNGLKYTLGTKSLVIPIL